MLHRSGGDPSRPAILRIGRCAVPPTVRMPMLQCESCEFFRRRTDGTPQLLCDPFATIKEPECLLKWQLVRLNVLAQSHQATLDMHRRLAPLQEKMFKHMERELDEAEEADQWKYTDAEDDEDAGPRI